MKLSDITNTQVCLAYTREPQGNTRHQILMRMTGAPEKLAAAACERAHKVGLIEYGVSLETGWLSAKGRLLVALEPITRISRVCVPPGTVMTEDKPVKDYIAGVWPTLADLKELEHAMLGVFGFTQ